MRTLLSLSIASLVCFLFSCGDSSDEDYVVNGKPIEQFLDSAELKSTSYLKIKNIALSHEFMFYGTFIPMLNSPTGHSLKGRIIRFEVLADRVMMLESPTGHSIGNTSESTIILAEFPIVQTETDGVVIDFAKGMTSAFTTRNVHSRALSDKGSGTSEQFRAIFLSASFVKSISIDKSVLTIRQIAQWRNAKSELVSAEFRYFFREYSPSPNFKKKVFVKNRWVQYFSTPPQLLGPTTESTAFIAKWSLERPIVFYISANTPAQHRGAIRDGILFWNHILGQELIQVKDLPEHLSAPHPHLNIVQWVPWDNEASAYADMVVDHLTGETLQAQIYLRSGWVFKSAKKLKSQLSEILLSPGHDKMVPIEESAPMPGMFDYEEPQFDSLSDYEALIELIQNMNAANISETTLSLLTSDIIRTVIAHEMGHVLGLRHNLGSSTSSNISLSERAHFLKEYLTTGNPSLGTDKYFSSSIMDVFSAADDALMGSQIRHLINSDLRTSPLATLYKYDFEAIRYGYFDEAMKTDTPFCTDDDLQRYLDCQRWDISSTPVLYAASRLSSLPTQVSVALAETFMQAFDPKRPGGALRAQDIPLSNTQVKKNAEAALKQLFFWFNQNARSIQVEAKNQAFGLQNQKEISKKRFQEVREELSTVDLNETLFSLMPPYRPKTLDSTQLAENFNFQLLKLILQAKKNEPEFDVSDEDIQDASHIAKNFFAALNDELIVQFSSIVSRMQFDDPELQMPIEESIGQIAREIVLRNNSSVNSSEPGALPVFSYSLLAREAAAQLLSPALGIIGDWSFDNLEDVTKQLKELMRMHAASKNGAAIDLASMPRDRRQWMFDQNRILNTLVRLKGMARTLTPLITKD